MLDFLMHSALVPIVIGAAAGFCLPALRRPLPMLALNAVVAAALYRTAFFGYALWLLIVYGITLGIQRLTVLEGRGRAKRWSYACAAMTAVLASYAAAAAGWFNAFRIGAFAIAALVPMHDMWLLLRSISFLWEFGSGRIKENRFLTYAIWMTLPFTMVGPLIRYSEFAPQFAKTEPARPTLASHIGSQMVETARARDRADDRRRGPVPRFRASRRGRAALAEAAHNLRFRAVGNVLGNRWRVSPDGVPGPGLGLGAAVELQLSVPSTKHLGVLGTMEYDDRPGLP